MTTDFLGSTGLALLLLTLAGGCDDAEVAPPPPAKTATATGEEPAAKAAARRAPAQPSGHRRMVADLARIANRADEEHHYLGSFRVRDLRAQLARADESAPWELRLQAARAELDLGNEREGIEILEQASRGLGDGTIEGDAEARLQIAFHLGVAYLRLGETENCCRAPDATSCILPIGDLARHQRKEGSTRAAAAFAEVLEGALPDTHLYRSALWLFNLAHLTLGTYPDSVPEHQRLPAPAFYGREKSFPHFRNVAPDLGLDTFSLSGGVVADDFDGDDDVDLLVSTWDTSGQLRLFRNDEGQFVDRTIEAGLEGLFGGLNMVQADYDNDGDVDVLVLRGAWLFEHGRYPNSLCRNNGDGTFTDVTRDAGLASRDLPTQTAAWLDFDLDGDLDLYVGNESSTRLAAPSQLFVNQGDGTFVDRAAEAGVTNDRFAKAVVAGDYDGDRLPDLYVSNNGAENRLYRNRGDGTFEDVAAKVGVEQPIASFPAWFWDYDNDGALDLYVSCYGTGIGDITAYHLGTKTHDRATNARLYRGDGSGRMRDVAETVGLDYPAMPMGSNFGDLDGDGFLDFYLGTGNVHYYSVMPSLLYRNVAGARFEDVTIEAGLAHIQKGHGIAFADFDRDGDLDVFAQMGGAYAGDGFHDALYENPGFADSPRFVQLELVGVQSNRSAIGARIRIEVEDDGGSTRALYRHVGSGGSFGASPLRPVIGLGRAARIRSIEVAWPNAAKSTQVFHDVPIGQLVRLEEGQGSLSARSLATFSLGHR